MGKARGDNAENNGDDDEKYPDENKAGNEATNEHSNNPKDEDEDEDEDVDVHVDNTGTDCKEEEEPTVQDSSGADGSSETNPTQLTTSPITEEVRQPTDVSASSPSAKPNMSRESKSSTNQDDVGDESSGDSKLQDDHSATGQRVGNTHADDAVSEEILRGDDESRCTKASAEMNSMAEMQILLSTSLRADGADEDMQGNNIEFAD